MADPVATDIDVVQGATFSMSVTWADKSTDPPTPIPLTGYRAHMQVRSRQGATGTPLLNLASIGSAPSLTLEPGGATGKVKVRISALNTAKLRRNCYYDVFVVKDDDATQATRLAFGQITLFKSATIDDLVDDTSGEPEDDSSGSTTSGVGIQSAVINSNGHLILTLTDGTTQDAGRVTGSSGTNGVGIASGSVNGSGHLILTLTDSSTLDVGSVVGGGGGSLPASFTATMPQPSDPTLFTANGVSGIKWDGLDSAGNEMPDGFSRLVFEKQSVVVGAFTEQASLDFTAAGEMNPYVVDPATGFTTTDVNSQGQGFLTTRSNWDGTTGTPGDNGEYYLSSFNGGLASFIGTAGPNLARDMGTNIQEVTIEYGPNSGSYLWLAHGGDLSDPAFDGLLCYALGPAFVVYDIKNGLASAIPVEVFYSLQSPFAGTFTYRYDGVRVTILDDTRTEIGHVAVRPHAGTHFAVTPSNIKRMSVSGGSVSFGDWYEIAAVSGPGAALGSEDGSVRARAMNVSGEYGAPSNEVLLSYPGIPTPYLKMQQLADWAGGQPSTGMVPLYEGANWFPVPIDTLLGGINEMRWRGAGGPNTGVLAGQSGDVITYKGGLWVFDYPSTGWGANYPGQPNELDNWKRIGDVRIEGSPLMRWTGDYDSTKDLLEGDVVRYNGQLYIATGDYIAPTTAPPSAMFDLLL